MVGLIVEASDIAKGAGQFHVFRTFQQKFFEGLPRPFYRHFLINLRAYYLNPYATAQNFTEFAQKT